MSVRHRSAHAAFWHVRRPAALLCALLALALLGSSFCAFAAAAPTKVRAGYFYNGDFMHKAADGSYEGYDIEYYYTLAGYANWDLSFVEYDSLNDALAGLQSGEIDIMEVVGAENGKLGVEAFAASAPGSFDAVLLDLRMAATESMTTTSMAPERTSASQISSACSPVSGWLTSRLSMSTPSALA